MQIDGSCHCGAIEYTGEIDRNLVGICHCRDCQTLSASAFRTIALIKGSSLEVTKGMPKKYIKTGDSGNRRVQAFCSDCGTGIYASDDVENPSIYNIRLGTVRQRDELIPVFECWLKSSHKWLPELQNTKKHEGNPKF